MKPVYFRAEQVIAAPPVVVWRVLTDLEGYAGWNPFTPRVAGSLELGGRVLLWARVGPLLMPQLERVTALDEGRELAWASTWPLGLLSARRVQRLVPTLTGSRYETEERFDGLLAPLVRLFAGGLVQRGLETTARALARQAEKEAA